MPEHESAFLWTVESDSARIDLFGSVHVGSPSMYPLDPRVYARFDAADTLAVEIDMTPEKAQTATVLLAQAAALPDGERVWEHLDQSTATLLKTQLKERGWPEDKFARLKPWFISLVLLMQDLDAGGFSPKLGLERHFQERAHGEKEVIELETVESQAQLLANLGMDAGAQDLSHALRTDSVSELKAIAEQWKVGKTDLLLKSLREMKAEYPKAYEQLFAARNRRMTDKVEELLASSRTVFFMVGAGHLVGPDGIVELLRQRGHTVSQL